ncbi:MAG: hypothetical protein D6714_16735 [Bacteroidetes bacterium]|nr:MAG: hypothetical protein D6714_16735 [Bacteroidota bacterium]
MEMKFKLPGVKCVVSLSFLMLTMLPAFAQSPHGDNLKMDCASCHSPEGWEIQPGQWAALEESAYDSTRFYHSQTRFPLTGSHAQVDCRACHDQLVFENTPDDCVSCHTDVHEMTVGSDCARCHQTNSWIVDDIYQIHFENGFPLLGAHSRVSCEECHSTASYLQFTRIGNDCINCHLDNFNATTNPDHRAANYSTNCVDCHRVDALDWSSDQILHDFFPLTKGHDISDCNACHTSPDFSDTSPDCFACHEDAFKTAESPNHQALGFSIDCRECHTTDPGWSPAKFDNHDALFPIYSGNHKGEWDNCTDCHKNPNNYSEFTCIECHEHNDAGKLQNKHNGVPGYEFNSQACFICHPDGSEDGAFNHDNTNFPLNGKHNSVSCSECHTNGYAGTPTECVACHEEDYNNATNPNHIASQFSTDCAACHTESGWKPANFDHDGEYFPIYSGKHKNEWDNCIECHLNPNDYSSFSCIDCHEHSNASKLADEHDEVSGYKFESAACYACHPDGSE